MKKIYKVSLIFLIILILSLCLTMLQSQAAGPGGGNNAGGFGGGSRGDGSSGSGGGSNGGSTAHGSSGSTGDDDDIGDIWNNAGSFINQGAQNGNSTIKNFFNNLKSDTAKNRFGEVIGIIWGIGLIVIFISTVVLGIRYMLVNPNEKSRIKQATTPYIIGVVVIFGAVTIWKLIINILEG